MFNSAPETCAGKSAALFVAPFNLCATDSCPRVHGRRTPRFSVLLLVIVVFRKHFCFKCSHEMALSCSVLPKILLNKLLSLLKSVSAVLIRSLKHAQQRSVDAGTLLHPADFDVASEGGQRSFRSPLLFSS